MSPWVNGSLLTPANLNTKGFTAYNIEDEVFGVTGDGSTDDFSNLQAAINALSTAGGGILVGNPGSTYRCVITSSVTDKGLVIKNGVWLYLNGATISLECTGSVYGVRFATGGHLIGGTVTTAVSSSPGSQGIFHAPLSVGEAYGDGGTVASPGTYVTVKDWSIRDVTVSSARSGGALISLIGDVYHGLIENVIIPDSANPTIGIGADWGSVGSIDSSDVAATSTAFNAGTAYTTHPHQITIRNIRIGALTNAASHGVRLSGVHDITVEKVRVTSTTYAGFYHTAGDLGYEFAPASVKPFRHRNIVIKDFVVEDANNGWGFFVDCYADNVDAAGGYSEVLPVIQEPGMLLERCETHSDAGASVIPGFRLQQVIGVTLKDCTAMGHSIGILGDTGADIVRVIGGLYRDNRSHGIHVHHGTDLPEDWIIDGARTHSNGTAGAAAYGILFQNCTNCIARNCKSGIVGEATQDYGMGTNGSSTYASFYDNDVLGVQSGGIAYVLGTSTGYTAVWEFRGNNSVAGITYRNGVDILPHRRTLLAGGTIVTYATALKASLTADITPTAGAWVVGDTIEYENPSSGGFKGVVCTTAGSPGTWKTYGVVS